MDIPAKISLLLKKSQEECTKKIKLTKLKQNIDQENSQSEKKEIMVDSAEGCVIWLRKIKSDMAHYTIFC